jgi:hypothetical protein
MELGEIFYACLISATRISPPKSLTLGEIKIYSSLVIKHLFEPKIYLLLRWDKNQKFQVTNT